MNRKDFLKSLALLPLAGIAANDTATKLIHTHSLMELNDLNRLTEAFGTTEQMPVLSF